MRIGFIGLGKMGGQMVARLKSAGHEVVAYDVDKEVLSIAAESGVETATDLHDLVGKLNPAIIWLMIPADYIDAELKALLEVLPPESIIIDGGNSDFRLTIKRAAACREKNVHFIDVGTSGGVLGLEKGFSMMVGGDTEAVGTIQPLIEALAQPDGWHHFGGNGSGHFIKMVHNAIEYGLMESYAEGYHLLQDGPFKDIDLAAAGKVWSRGSIIGSLLNDLTVEALEENPKLEDIAGYVAESGEAKWALETADFHQINMPAIKAALDVRLASQQGKTSFATKLLAAMRNKFGGHALNK